MRRKLVKGDAVVIQGEIQHIREDGYVDVRIGKTEVLFDMHPDDLGLLYEEEDEDDDSVA